MGLGNSLMKDVRKDNVHDQNRAPLVRINECLRVCVCVKGLQFKIFDHSFPQIEAHVHQMWVQIRQCLHLLNGTKMLIIVHYYTLLKSYFDFYILWED